VGFVEWVKPDGTMVHIENDTVTLDVINFKDCCELCNDPRMVHEGDLVKCVGCGCINHVDFGHNKNA
jgi:hypothetical protein